MNIERGKLMIVKTTDLDDLIYWAKSLAEELEDDRTDIETLRDLVGKVMAPINSISKDTGIE